MAEVSTVNVMQRPRRGLPILVALIALVLATGAVVAVFAGSRPTVVPAAATWGVPSASPVTSSGAAAAPSSAASPPPTVSGTPSGRPTATSGGAARTSTKKGVSTWSFAGMTQALADVHASWYYNWAADRGTGAAPAGVEFVPMIWGGAAVTSATLARVKTQGHVLLGFNEPDFSSQSNLTVDQALALWPQLMATGMRLGSPAPATGASSAGGWLDRFMTGAASHGYRVDFIALHWYGSDFAPGAATGQLRSYLQATYDRYHVPIWLTEYALINFSGSAKYPSPSQQAAFVTQSTTMLAALPYVERYAWFALPSKGTDTGLYRDGSTPTSAGAAYRAAG